MDPNNNQPTDPQASQVPPVDQPSADMPEVQPTMPEVPVAPATEAPEAPAETPAPMGGEQPTEPTTENPGGDMGGGVPPTTPGM